MSWFDALCRFPDIIVATLVGLRGLRSQVWLTAAYTGGRVLPYGCLWLGLDCPRREIHASPTSWERGVLLLSAGLAFSFPPIPTSVDVLVQSCSPVRDGGH
jgi:hypothetical protein